MKLSIVDGNRRSRRFVYFPIIIYSVYLFYPIYPVPMIVFGGLKDLIGMEVNIRNTYRID
jgi:hypothetical protein